jgi:radical SAM superfamily enzyme with C-terminal helix-hairpin-helix motif
MARTPSRYAIHLLLAGGQTQVVHFPTLDAFQQWYGTVLNAGPADAFINVPITELPGEYLVVRPSAVQGIRVEPIYGALDDDEY